MADNDQTTTKGKNGGARPGAGRPKGAVDPLTKKKQLAEKRLKSRVFRVMDKLLDQQLSLAQGVTHLFKIEETKDAKGRVTNREHVMVTDPEEIKRFLDKTNGGYGGTIDEGPDAEYYYVTTKAPDNRAIDSLLDRAFGRAPQAVEVGGKDGGPLVFSIGDYKKTLDDQTEGQELADAI